MRLKSLLVIVVFCFLSFPVQAQDKDSTVIVTGYGTTRNSRLNSANSAAMKLSRTLETSKSDEQVAENYVKLAKELSGKEDYAKAEDYLKRARALYVKLKDKEKIASMDRELAKVQEAQNKVSEAISNYMAAGSMSKETVQQQVNLNDAYRLQNVSNPQKQKYYLGQNIELYEQTNSTEDMALAYQQRAQVNLDLNDREGAITDYKSALSSVRNKPEEAIKINREIAKTYVADNQLEKAIDINEKLVTEAKKTNDPKVEIEQLQTLSNIYFEADKSKEGLQVLQQAYDLAVHEGRTLDAKNSLELLVDQYKKEKNTKKALEVYANFMDRLEPLIKGDSTLIDEKFFQVQEAKIAQLEKERALKDELITKTNTFNYALIIFILLVLIALAFIAKALYSIKKKNKKIALQSLRREMNPHFIFNSLNSVNQFIAQNNELEANKYLSSYSKLMRNIMENSNKDFISLSTEMEQMKEYLDLEYMRFHDKFEYRIDIDNSLDTDAIYIPNMLIQPQLENAIWHGLRYKEGKGLLTLTIEAKGNSLNVIIEDDGIGLTKSKELKTKHQREHKSRGLTNTYERISLLNSLYGLNISVDIIEKTEPHTGVVVTLQFPLMDKTHEYTA